MSVERAIRHVVVVIPARDEEHLVRRCLESVYEACQFLSGSHPDVCVNTVLVADACIDRTAEIGRGLPGVVVLETISGVVGAARAYGIDYALSHLPEVEASLVWIANTDADSAVPADWLTKQVRLADSGVDVMIGTVRPDPADLTVLQNDMWLQTHPRGRPNGHVHGANLGMRASRYLDVGGFESVEEHEDNLIVDRLRLGEARIMASDSCQVLTSGRFMGRTPGGYAGYLAATL